MKTSNSTKTSRKSSCNKAQADGVRSSEPAEIAIGFRVKSGRAVAVVLAGPYDSPQVLARREIKLCDPAAPDSMQPYHAALEMPGPKAAKEIERLVKIVQRATSISVGELIREWGGAAREANATHESGARRESGATYESGVRCQIRGAGLVVGSLIDPAKIANDHIRAHALEGQLFRVSVQEALAKNGLTSPVFTERDLYSTAAAELGRSEEEMKRAASELGRTIAGPWRADEKTAALAAWIVLAK